MKAAARECLVCPFAMNSTQTVFGDGPGGATIMIVGEQPGDREDREGSPFVGPAGALLDEILSELKIPRGQIYVTNAVKHFKFVKRGKFRLHQKPVASEINACRPWLEKEVELIEPEVILALGATAAQSLCGRVVRVTQERGQWLASAFAPGVRVRVTWHPAAILRARGEEERSEKRTQLLEDVREAWRRVRAVGRSRVRDSELRL